MTFNEFKFQLLVEKMIIDLINRRRETKKVRELILINSQLTKLYDLKYLIMGW